MYEGKTQRIECDEPVRDTIEFQIQQLFAVVNRIEDALIIASPEKSSSCDELKPDSRLVDKMVKLRWINERLEKVRELLSVIE